MQKSLYLKLSLAFFLIAVITAGLIAVFIRLTSIDRLTKLILDQQRSTMEQVLTEYYTASGSWDGIVLNWRSIQTWAFTSQMQGPGNPNRQQMGERGLNQPGRFNLFGLADQNNVILVAVDNNYPAGSTLPPRLVRAGSPITVDNVQVGTLLTARRLPSLTPEEIMFISRTNQALLLAMLGAFLIAILLAVLLARTLTRPLRALTQAAQGITRGQLEQEVQVNSQDEIGELAAAFNQMSREVARVNQLRRQMTADIAHDLRTPLTVISGYIESMRDGVLQPTPERMALIYTEIERLQTMVGDLRMLSQVDAGEISFNPQKLAPRQLLLQAAGLFQHHAGQQEISLQVETSDPLPEIMADEARLMQVLDNLISNALRYTPAGGKITLRAVHLPGRVRFSVQDTGSGIDPKDLPYIFNRFHRVDSSRHAENGESGLGLAIVKALVEAQGGTVWAESTPGSGATLYFEFPAGSIKTG